MSCLQSARDGCFIIFSEASSVCTCSCVRHVYATPCDGGDPQPHQLAAASRQHAALHFQVIRTFTTDDMAIRFHESGKVRGSVKGENVIMISNLVHKLSASGCKACFANVMLITDVAAGLHHASKKALGSLSADSYSVCHSRQVRSAS